MTVDVVPPSPMPSGGQSSAAELLRLTSAGWVAQAIAVAARLRLADVLTDGAKDVGELAAETGTHAPSLYRLLRALASVGIFAEDHDGRFGLTPLATPLRSDVPGSVWAMCAMRGETWFLETWAELLHSVQTGEPAFEHRHGASLFAFLTDHPAAMALFAEAMTSMSATECAAVLAGYDFSTATTIVDVGGGQGHLLAAILRSSPNARGVLFDLPATTARAHETLDAADVTDRCVISDGDFFDAVPDGGDLYVLNRSSTTGTTIVPFASSPTAAGRSTPPARSCSSSGSSRPATSRPLASGWTSTCSSPPADTNGLKMSTARCSSAPASPSPPSPRPPLTSASSKASRRTDDPRRSADRAGFTLNGPSTHQRDCYRRTSVDGGSFRRSVRHPDPGSP